MRTETSEVRARPPRWREYALVALVFASSRLVFFWLGLRFNFSLDSRAWGYFPANYLIGKSFFVYWPITDRFGWGYHR